MTVNRYYSSTAVATTLTAGVSNSATTLPVAATTGFPGSFPYTLILEKDTANEEIVTVTNASGLNLTVTRGVDGSTAVSHSLGATVEHGVSARDFREPQEHIDATGTVHGLTGSIVGTTDTQVLTGKTISGASNTLSNIPESAVTNLVTDLAGKAASSHTHAESDVTSLVADLAAKEATANKGVASGYASLDGSVKVPIAQIPTGSTGTTVPLGNHTHNTLYSGVGSGVTSLTTTVSSGTPGPSNAGTWSGTVTANVPYAVYAQYQGHQCGAASVHRCEWSLSPGVGTIAGDQVQYQSSDLTSISEGGLIAAIWTPTSGGTQSISLRIKYLSGASSITAGNVNIFVVALATS